MTKVTFMRGIPASGKTTSSYEIARKTGATRVCLDDLRSQIGDYSNFSRERETLILNMQDAMILAAVRQGNDVVVDETVLGIKTPRRIAQILWEAGFDVEYEIADFTDVPFDVCCLRDETRLVNGHRGVGMEVMRRMKSNLDKQKRQGLWTVEDLAMPAIVPYEAPEGAPKAFILDMDGTIAKITNRGPYDYSLCHQDEVNEAVKAVVCGLAEDGNQILITSGRANSAAEMTHDWLDANGIPWDNSFFRTTGDDRRDSIVKLELFNRYIRDEYDVRGAIDDRLRVCQIWHALGLPLFRVGDPCGTF